MGLRKLQQSATISRDDGPSVGIRDLRDHLSAYLERVKAGERIVSSAYTPRLLELIATGDVTPATQPMPDLRSIPRATIPGSTADLIDEIRG